MPGEWHNNMEEYFPKEMREVKFYCSSSVSNTCRRADICLDDIRTCEIQHSYISENEIVKRCNDWKKFGKKIIWLVDGNEGVEVDKLSTGNYLLTFNQVWKYKSFMKTYDYILLEKDDLIFKIELKKIRSGMIELKESKTLQETIDFLKTKPTEIWNFWSDDNFIKSTLSVYQQGAGNGKTYGIWKSITENEDRKTYIIVTKQHSAKNVIYEELRDQKDRIENGEEIYHIKNIERESEYNTEKHFVIKYTHKLSGRECTVIIGTIDSFCYNLSHSNANGSKFFEGIVDNISENGPTKVNNGYMRFGGQNIQLSKESEIWIDEVQDLPENYLHAMIKLMYETFCYMNIVGDKLQSLEYTNNFLTGIDDEGLPNIIIDKKKAINKNRRIKVTNMGNKINELIKFKDHHLPEIYCDERMGIEVNNNPIKIIKTPKISNDTNKKIINTFCDNIMNKYIYEVEKNGFLPKDFLIIFPIMKVNILASELETKIQEYWLDKEDPSDDKYTQYAYLHKHTEGSVINTNDSVNATRIMSIRSSKGDGRKVVFILEVTEGSLKKVSNKEKGLVYESHLHVSLTRAKNQIYFGLNENNDDIHKRFSKVGYVEYLPKISKSVQLDKINELINKDKIIELLKNHINQNSYIKDKRKIVISENVDWGYHCIKRQTYYYQVILNIINGNNNSCEKSQLFVILKKLSKIKLAPYNVNNFYKYLDKYQYNNDEEMEYFPLCILSKQSEYKKYYKIIGKSMVKVQKTIENHTLDKLDIYHQIILTYMIQIYTQQRYADMTPMDVYNVTDFFTKNPSKETELLKPIDNVKSIILKSGINDYENMEWNIYKHVALNGGNENFKISKLQYPILGNNKTDIIHIVLKNDLSQLNYWDTMIEILLERFLIYNPKSKKDKIKFEGKKINTYLFLLDKNKYIKIDWNWDKELNNEIKSQLKEVLKDYFRSYHDDIFKYLDFFKKSDKWNNNPSKIIGEIIHKFEKMINSPKYIIDVFKFIETKIDDEEDYDDVNDLNRFNDRLNRKLQKHIVGYLS